MTQIVLDAFDKSTMTEKNLDCGLLHRGIQPEKKTKQVNRCDVM